MDGRWRGHVIGRQQEGLDFSGPLGRNPSDPVSYFLQRTPGIGDVEREVSVSFASTPFVALVRIVIAEFP
jgi:hypothetical protein